MQTLCDGWKYTSGLRLERLQGMVGTVVNGETPWLPTGEPPAESDSGEMWAQCGQISPVSLGTRNLKSLKCEVSHFFNMGNCF